MKVFCSVIKRLKSCFADPTPGGNHMQPTNDQLVREKQTRALQLTVGAYMEAVVQHRCVRPPEQNLLLEKAEHNP